MRCWPAGGKLRITLLYRVRFLSDSRNWSQGGVKKKGHMFAHKESIGNRRKCLISLFFFICSPHPVSWLRLHREPHFYHQTSQRRGHFIKGVCFAKREKDGWKSEERLRDDLNLSSVFYGHYCDLPNLLCDALTRVDHKFLLRQVKLHLTSYSSPTKALPTSPYWKPSGCVPLWQETGVLLWLEEKQ